MREALLGEIPWSGYVRWGVAGEGPHLVVPWFGLLAVIEPVADRVVMFECDGTEDVQEVRL